MENYVEALYVAALKHRNVREYAKQDPEKVIEMTNTYPLSNLSRREALKHIKVKLRRLPICQGLPLAITVHSITRY